jgi:hypothetical protein
MPDAKRSPSIAARYQDAWNEATGEHAVYGTFPESKDLLKFFWLD